MKSVCSDETGRIINKVNKISCCVPLTSLYFKKKAFFKLRRSANDVPGIAENWHSKSSGLKCSEHRWEVGVNVHFALLTRTKLIHSRLLFVSLEICATWCSLKGMINRAPMAQLVEHRVVTREVVSSTAAGPTLRVLKYLRIKCYLCNYISKWLDLKSSRIRTINRRSRLEVPSMFKMSTWDVKYTIRKEKSTEWSSRCCGCSSL